MGRRPGGGIAARRRHGTVEGNVTDALTTLLGSVTPAIISLVIVHDGLRARLRQAGHVGLPVVREATATIAAYLAAERDLGRIPRGADVDTLVPMLVGAGHLRKLRRARPLDLAEGPRRSWPGGTSLARRAIP